MKKRAVALLLCLVFSCIFASVLGENIGMMTVVNCEEWVSLRNKPDAGAKRVLKVPLGATVTNCSRYSDTFIYAEYDGRSGYILAEYLEPVEVREQYLGELRVANCTDWVNMRAEPGMDAKRIAKVPLGAVLKDCKAAENGFVYCRYQDKEGYISAAYVQSAEGFAASDQLTDCRIHMVNMESVGGAALISQSVGGAWSILRERSQLDAAIAALPDGFREMAKAIPDERIIEIAGGRELYLIIPADEAASVSVIELTPGTKQERGGFKRVAYNSARGESILLRCNAGETAQGEGVIFDCEVNIVNSRGEGITWYPRTLEDGETLDQETAAGEMIVDFTDACR